MTLQRIVWQHNGEKKKVQKEKTIIYKTYIWSKRSSNMSPTKDRGELRCSRRVCRSWSISGTRRVNIVTNPIISREWIKDRAVLTIIGTYRGSLWLQIFYNGQPSHDGDNSIFGVMTSPLPKGTVDFSSFRVSCIF